MSEVYPKPGVLIIGNFLSSHLGTRSYCEDLAIRLNQTGWRSITASDKISKPLRLYDMLYKTWRYRHDYQVAQVDVFNDRAFIWAELTCLVMNRLRKPYILTIHAGNMPDYARRFPRRVGNLLRSARFVTTPSRYLAHELSFLGADIMVIPNAIDLSAYSFRERSIVHPRLVWLRAFHKVYNPLMAVEVLNLLKNDFPDIYLLMIGPDKHDGTLDAVRAAVKKYALEKNVVLHEAISKSRVPSFLAAHDIFLNTTTAESFGVSVLEAAATGLCIVSTAVGELPLLWTDEYDALLTPSNNPNTMAQAVRRILNEPDLALSLSRNARATAERYDWSVVLPQWKQLLRNAAETPAG